MPVAALLGVDLGVIAAAAITAFVTALATAIPAARVKLWLESRVHRSKADIDYEYEQRKKLRDAIAAHHAPLLEAALGFNYRLVNLAKNSAEGWLNVGGNYGGPLQDQYYFQTTGYRFAVLLGFASDFEAKSLVIDTRVARPTDLTFLLYAKAMRWAMTDVALFEGLDYDRGRAEAHFFTDRLRQLCATMLDVNGRVITLAAFEEQVQGSDELHEILRFFDGLNPGQLRWDRLMALQLILLAFINTFGYDFQRAGEEWFERVVNQINHDDVVRNLDEWLPRLGLTDDRAVAQVRAALGRRLTTTA